MLTCMGRSTVGKFLKFSNCYTLKICFEVLGVIIILVQEVIVFSEGDVIIFRGVNVIIFEVQDVIFFIVEDFYHEMLSFLCYLFFWNLFGVIINTII